MQLLSQLFRQAPHDHDPLQGRQMVDEQDPVEVVDLMLQAGGEQALGLDLPGRALPGRGSGP